MLGRDKMEPYNSVLSQLNSNCGETIEQVEPVVALSTREKLEQMRAELKKSASSQMQAAKSQLDLMKSSRSSISSINEPPAPKSNSFFDGMDEDQLQNTLAKLKEMMKANGIEPDEEFKIFENDLENFVEHGSASFWTKKLIILSINELVFLIGSFKIIN